jgi:hypothetical protein
MSDTNLKNIALLIDADNANADGIDPVLTVLAELGSVNIRRAYGNWAKAGLKGWSKILHRYGISPHQMFDLTKGKNATDMAMTIDAMDLLNQGKVDGFGIMSSDSDFTPLAMRLRQDGAIVYGFGKSGTPEAFQNACTRFIEVEALIAAEKQDDARKSETPTKRGSQPVDEELIDLLSTAWKKSKRDSNGFAKLSEMGQILNNRSSLDARNYGFDRLSDLIEAAGSQFKVERRDDVVYVKRLR